jgi:RNA polymerase sigma-70 factor (ECF subfamily)
VPGNDSQSAQRERLLEEFAAGNKPALDELLASYRGELREYIQLRLDPRLAQRLDASDVVQEVQISVVQRIDDYLQRRPMSFSLWLRRTALDRLADLRRHHHRRRRSVKAEAQLPDRTSLALARSLVAPGSSPSLNLAADELAAELNRALAELPEADREILVMRQLERLPFKDIALVLDIDASTAGKRFARALLKLEEVLRGRGLMH